MFQLLRASQLAPEDASLAHDLGVAFYKRGRAGKAIEALARASALRPDARTSYALGLAHEGARDAAAALAAFREAVRLDPRFLDAHVALGDALAALGEHDEAIAVLDAVLRLDRTNEGAAHNREVLARARDEAQRGRLLGRDHGAIERGALVRQSGMKLEAAWAAPDVAGTRATLLPRLRHRWPEDRLERWSDRISDLFVVLAGGTVRSLMLVLRDPAAAAAEPDRWGLQLVGDHGPERTVDYATAVHLALLRDALGVSLTRAARLWRELVAGAAVVHVDDARVERATLRDPGGGGAELPGLRATL